MKIQPGQSTRAGGVVTLEDAEQFSVALRRVNLEVMQTGNGRFRATVATLATGPWDVQASSTNRPIVAIGAINQGRLGFLFALRKPAELSCSGESIGDELVAVYPAGSEMLLRIGPDTQLSLIAVTPDALARSARALHGREPILPRRGFGVVRPAPAEIEAIRALLTQSLVATEGGQPYPTGLKSAIVRAVRKSLTRMVMEGEAARPVRDRTIFFRRVFPRVEGLLAGNMESAIRLEKMCDAAGVSRPALERVFLDFLGVDPLSYLKLRRLHQVHRALVRADPATTAVADVARAWGFAQQRSFTAEFTALFGNSPSQALRRPGARFPA